MYLRPHHRDKDGKRHTYWSLVETIRTPDGPRQRTLCHLGELNDSAQARWLKTIDVFNDAGDHYQLKLFPSDIAPPSDDAEVAQVLVQRVRLERTRQLGPALLGLALWRQLGLDAFFEARVDAVPADVPWSRVAAVLAINRLCAPGSELAIEERWYPTTALDDLLHVPAGTINDSRLYRTLDHLLPHKTALERHLTGRYGELFAAEFDVLLYDLTSSYVEGAAPKNPMMHRGYSRDHRPDCLQVVLAVIVNVDGFPLSYETFNGNRADVTTLETVMRMVERKYGQARRVWVFDRGIVSDANLAAIRRRGGQYLVGTRRSTLRHVEQALLEGPWTQVREEVEAQLVPIPGGTETYVLCRSTARREKELAIRRRFSTRLEDRLRRLAQRVAAGRLKDRAKIERVLGRLQASYASVADLYEMAVRDEDGLLRLHWQLIEDRRAWRDAREGAYLLRTNLVGQTRRGPLDQVHPVDGGGGRLSRLEKRAGGAPGVSSAGAAGEGPPPGRVSRIRVMGDAQAPAPPDRHRPHAGAGLGAPGHAAERRHYLADHRWARDPASSRDAAHARATAAARSARHPHPQPPRMECRM